MIYMIGYAYDGWGAKAMNFRDLQYVLAVAETQNFNQAAIQCHVSQPTLSTQIKKLEDQLGVLLFERTNKRVMITDAGARILERAKYILREEQNIREIARLSRDPSAGEFKLGAIPTLASYVFPTYVPAIGKAFPRLKPLLIEEKTDRLIEQIKAGRIDAALLALPIEEDTLATAPLFDDPFFLAVGADHALANRARVKVDDLEDHKLLLLDEGHCLRDQALAVCRAHGAEEEEGFRATSLETIRQMLRVPNSDLMTLMPMVAVQSNDDLHYIPFGKPSPSRHIGLVWRKTTPRAALIEQLRALLVKLPLPPASKSPSRR